MWSLLWLVAAVSLNCVAVEARGGEKASFQATPFTDVSYRQDFCSRYQDVLSKDGSLTLRNALSGMKLRPVIQYGPAFPYFNYSDEAGIDPDSPGIVANFLDYIAEQANFTWRDSFGVYTADDKGANRTWTSMLQWTTNTYDISIDKWAQSTERLNLGISYCDSWFDGSLILVDRIEPVGDSDTVNYGNWLRPFDTSVWILTVITIFVSCFVYLFLESLAGERDGRSFRVWFMDNLYLSGINFTQNYAYEPKSLSGRIFGFSFAFWTMLIGATYTANLASLLVERQQQPLKITDIEDAIARDFSLCTFSNSYSDLYIKGKYGQAKRVPQPSPEAMYEAVNAGECDVLIGTKQAWDGFQAIEEYNPNCDLEWVGRTVQPVVAAFTTKVDPGILCTGLVNEVFNYYLSEMKDNQFFDNQWNDFNAARATPNFNCDANSQAEDEARRRKLLSAAPSNNIDRNLKGGGGGGAVGAAAAAGGADGGDDESSLTLEQMAGTFLLHAIGSCVAIIFGMLSYYEKKSNTKRHGPKSMESTSLDSSETSDKSVPAQLEELRKSQKELSVQMSMMLSMLQNMKDRDIVVEDYMSATSDDEKGTIAKVKSFFTGGTH